MSAFQRISYIIFGKFLDPGKAKLKNRYRPAVAFYPRSLSLSLSLSAQVCISFFFLASVAPFIFPFFIRDRSVSFFVHCFQPSSRKRVLEERKLCQVSFARRASIEIHTFLILKCISMVYSEQLVPMLFLSQNNLILSRTKKEPAIL